MTTSGAMLKLFYYYQRLLVGLFRKWLIEKNALYYSWTFFQHIKDHTIVKKLMGGQQWLIG